MIKSRPIYLAPPRPPIGFNLGVTGHRHANQAFSNNRHLIEATLDEIMTSLDAAIAHAAQACPTAQRATTSLFSLLVDGFDQMAARQALARQWDVVAPLPFGRSLNTAINAHPIDHNEARALIERLTICSPQTQMRADQIEALMAQSCCFELADQDDMISALFLEKLAAPDDIAKAQAYSFAASQRVVLGAQVMIEQTDLIIGVWDGASTSFTGGTGHTIALALSMGAPVLWIDARAPQAWRILYAPEALADCSLGQYKSKDDRQEGLAAIVTSALQSSQGKSFGPHAHSKKSSYLEDMAAMDGETWPHHSPRLWHAYRRVEALFGGTTFKERFVSLHQTYESPQSIAVGSLQRDIAAANALPGQNVDFVDKIERNILQRFAWADGISSRLSDTYRGGMVSNFVFSALAIVSGIAYLPFASGEEKWLFALCELAFLGAILAITFTGQRRRWHGRWFETRRVGEYLRHAHILLLMGVARPAHRWPKGTHTSWPEFYARHSLRGVGLPQIAITTSYLRAALSTILLPHVSGRITYHLGKAKRLARVHHQLDMVSEVSFKLAVASVSLYLVLKLGMVLNVADSDTITQFSKLFTFLGVLFPTFGGAAAGIRYFGDFERFSAISDVTAQKLAGVKVRIQMLLNSPINCLNYAQVAEITHATDDIVVAEIESWQAVFSGKHITVPV
jgi:hypothetical protein